MASVKKYPIIGGPLDGHFANNRDFQPAWVDTYNRTHNRPHLIRDVPEGQFHAHQHEYISFNNASGRWHTDWSSMIWVHISLLKQSVKVPQ